MALTEKEKTWFENQIQKYDEKGEIIELDNSSNLIKYTSSIQIKLSQNASEHLLSLPPSPLSHVFSAVSILLPH